MGNVQIVGVLNVTPDSYYDGGQFVTAESAVQRAGDMLSDGADIIEIGGESTGPGSPNVSLEEEQTRVISIIKALRSAYPKARLSIDTYKAAIAKAAVEEGVSMVNDITAGRGESAMLSVVAESGVQYVLMYAKDDSPRTTIENTQYDDCISTVSTFLRERKEAAQNAGVAAENIILDPGMGHFVSSDPQYSFLLLVKLSSLAELKCPLFVSPSRKSFLAGTENLPASERLSGTLAASAIAVLHGAVYIRTHDILPVRQACEIAESIRTIG
jgi:dihydropteroate synthase